MKTHYTLREGLRRDHGEEAYSLFISGMLQSDIAKKLNVSVSAMSDALTYMLYIKRKNPDIIPCGKREPYHRNELDYGVTPNYTYNDLSQAEKMIYYFG